MKIATKPKKTQKTHSQKLTGNDVTWLKDSLMNEGYGDGTQMRQALLSDAKEGEYADPVKLRRLIEWLDGSSEAEVRLYCLSLLTQEAEGGMLEAQKILGRAKDFADVCEKLRTAWSE